MHSKVAWCRTVGRWALHPSNSRFADMDSGFTKLSRNFYTPRPTRVRHNFLIRNSDQVEEKPPFAVSSPHLLRP
ncbi:hypothetical protein JRO89_XS07G0079100 [Xanthoceras sorbifolium]|uniref:Uncharacterized protein n=1 Tax=Xanthoceras sorbifolium TaxID=99658 RepID=A0ABQ8HT63_9ROSI|nr:hypothetical protein JRO89_XS07G0079100 [Xanthoceras sorbifolium]